MKKEHKFMKKVIRVLDHADRVGGNAISGKELSRTGVVEKDKAIRINNPDKCDELDFLSEKEIKHKFWMAILTTCPIVILVVGCLIAAVLFL